jgi:hypothetical protein
MLQTVTVSGIKKKLKTPAMSKAKDKMKKSLKKDLKKKDKKLKKKAKKEKKIKIKTFPFEITLKLGRSADFIELDKYGADNKRIFKPRLGKPYWMFNSKGIIENKNYILDEHTDLEDFKIYLMNEQILIPIS